MTTMLAADGECLDNVPVLVIRQQRDSQTPLLRTGLTDNKECCLPRLGY